MVVNFEYIFFGMPGMFDFFFFFFGGGGGGVNSRCKGQAYIERKKSTALPL